MFPEAAWLASQNVASGGGGEADEANRGGMGQRGSVAVWEQGQVIKVFDVGERVLQDDQVGDGGMEGTNTLQGLMRFANAFMGARDAVRLHIGFGRGEGPMDPK